MKKIILALTVVTPLVLGGCAQTDVVGKYSISSFEAILNGAPNPVVFDEINNGWALKSPGGESFTWGKDFSTANTPDLMMTLDGTPFLKAGLKAETLDQEMYLFDAATNTLMIHAEAGEEVSKYDGEPQPIDGFKRLVKTHRDRIGYHEVLDHYGVKLGDGNMVEWAKDMATNDKDLVFVLNPKPLIEAGVDPEKVEGWIFTQVEVKNDQGQTEMVDKFLKPYDFK